MGYRGLYKDIQGSGFPKLFNATCSSSMKKEYGDY